MIKQVEPEQFDSQQERIIPSSDFILNDLGINPQKIKFIKPLWKRTSYRAVINWLTKYKAQKNSSNLVKVKGLLETFNHLCELENWNAAYKILLIKLNTPSNQDLRNQMFIWSYYREQINLYTKLVGKLSPDIDLIILRSLGNNYYSLTKHSEAIYYFEQSLNVARKIGNYHGEGAALGNLGVAYLFLGRYEQAIDYFNQHLISARKEKDLLGESRALSNLGTTYYEQGNYGEAIKYHKLRLPIAEEINDRRGIGNAYGNLGNAYNGLGNYVEAKTYHEKHLNIAQEINDRLGESASLCNLGYSLLQLDDFSKALEYLNLSLTISREIGSLNLEAEILKNLAEFYQKTNQSDLANKYCDQALELSTRMKIPLAKKCQELKITILNQ